MSYVHIVNGQWEMTEKGHRKVKELVGLEYDHTTEDEQWMVIKAWANMMMETGSEVSLWREIDQVRREARARAGVRVTETE